MCVEYKKFFLFAAFMLCITNVFAASGDNVYVKTNRYTNTAILPTNQQDNLLSVVVQLRFPKQIKTVGEAVNYLLKNSGYKIEKIKPVNNSQYFLYSLNLPEIHRQLGPIKLENALKVLGNEGFNLVVNPVKRTIGYRLDKSFHNHLSQNDIEEAKSRWTNKTVGKVSKNTSLSIMENSHKSFSIKTYGPVEKGESLSSISRQLNLSGVDVNQVMISIFESNRESFAYENVNILLVGSFLNIPDLEVIKSMSILYAKSIVEEDTTEWKKMIARGVL